MILIIPKFIFIFHFLLSKSLQLKIVPVPEQKGIWLNEELEILEGFFESKVSLRVISFNPQLINSKINYFQVVSAPYKPNAFLAYSRLLNAHLKIIKDFIQLMRLEMVGFFFC